MSSLQQDQTFEKIHVLEGYKYENCRFVNCDFSRASFAGIVFIDCEFDQCNLLLVETDDTGMQDVKFSNCKLSGVNFGKCREFAFGVSFSYCVLDNAVFYKRKMKGIKFIECSMLETDFTECDLTSAMFQNCNLQNAFFEKTILRQSDFRSSYNFIIDPDKNDIRKAKFSLYGLPGLLMKYGITVE